MSFAKHFFFSFYFIFFIAWEFHIYDMTNDHVITYLSVIVYEKWWKTFGEKKSIWHKIFNIQYFLLKIHHNLLTFGKSLRWFASSNSSSRLLAYLMISSGTFANDWCRLSIYSTWRLHPLNNGIHLNIFTEFLSKIFFKIFFVRRRHS